ncbi:MAG TPA: hypothetical protein VHX60_14830 [Acidobacteriaceae bacterium]|nr:hypothetical protein [Acidobacteriaceae bacterium]
MTTEAIAPAIAPALQHSAWTPLTRVAFRIAFLYFAFFVFISRNGNLFDLFPVVGGWINNALQWPPDHASLWIGRHVFHLTGLAAAWQPTGSGDSALNWIEAGLYVAVALAGGLLWSLVAALRGNRRTEYATLNAWLRFLVRLTCGGFMLIYGFSKVFPMQMAPISIGILNEPVGNMSPMTMLWALIGLHPAYEIVCGLAEVIGGVLLLFRRTALLGALISAFVITNVLLYNLFFDVPVKLFAANLLLGCLFLAVPDLRALFDFFWLHKPTVAQAVWMPAASRSWARITLRIVEIGFTFALLVLIPYSLGQAWRQNRKQAHTSTPLLGAWHLDATHPATGAFITGDGAPATDLYIDTAARAFTRSVDGALWRTHLSIDAKAHTITVNPYGRDEVKYSWQMPDANHFVLATLPPDPPKQKEKASAPAKAFTPQVMSFTRTPIMAHYPLLDRGFHFINQWGYER